MMYSPQRMVPGKPVAPIQPGNTQIRNRNQVNPGNQTSFQELLNRSIGQTPAESLKISNHASIRMQQRGIELSGEDMERLQQATQQAADKGSRDALVMMDGQAYIISVKNRTIVTAMDQADLKSQVITNIDSAVIAPQK